MLYRLKRIPVRYRSSDDLQINRGYVAGIPISRLHEVSNLLPYDATRHYDAAITFFGNIK
jgi:flagellar basal body rod protein FlgC